MKKNKFININKLVDWNLLSSLILEWKKTNRESLLTKIFILLKPMIKIKSEFVSFQIEQWKITQKEIEQELYFKIFQLLKSYNSKSPFKNYLLKSLKYWLPKIPKADATICESLYNFENDNSEETEERFEGKPMNLSNLLIEDIFKVCTTEKEKKICKLYMNDMNITEEELGKELGITKQAISLILKKLRKRLKNYLTKSNFR